MAKKKKRKESKKSFEHAAELYGILLVLIAILGLGKYGVVGKFFTSFSIFLFGSIYMLFLVSILIIGAYLVVKRQWPDFFTTKLIGIYVFTLGLLILMHQGFIEKESNMMNIFKETINELVASFNSVMNTGELTDFTAVGGGIIGGVFAILFDALFSYTGMQIVSWTLIGLGFLLFVGFSLFDTLKEKYKNRSPREKKEKVKDKSKGVIIKDGTEELTTELKDEGKHIKISSIDEITKVEQAKASEEDPVETKLENKSSTNRDYKLPSIDLLDKPKKKNKATDNSVIEKNIATL